MTRMHESEDPHFDQWACEMSPFGYNEHQIGRLLDMIYPGCEVSIMKSIPTEYLEARNAVDSCSMYIVDVLLESESIVVFVDTAEYYRDAQRIMYRERQQKRLSDAGYKVVRIPFFVQLNRETVQHFFGKLISDKYDCDFMSGFYELDDYNSGPNPYTPANMCSMGWNNFLADVMSLPKKTYNEVMKSLKHHQDTYGQELTMIAFPSGLECKNCPIGKENQSLEEAWNQSVCYCGTPQ